MGIPDIIEVTEFGFLAKPAFNDPVNPDYTAFVLSVSASLDLPIGDSSVTADLDNLTIDVGQLASGDLLNALDFDSIAVAFGPFDFGAVKLEGNLFIEKFDATPGVADRESLIVKFGGSAIWPALDSMANC